MNANAPHLDAAARDTDHAIDRTLTALRDAHPRSGLESRILHALEHRATAPQSTRFHLSAHLALWTAASAAVLAIASLVILHRQIAAPVGPTTAVILSEASRPHGEATLKGPEIARATTSSKSFSTTNFARTNQTVSSRPERAARSGETCISDHRNLGCGITTTPTDAQLLADLHAPSHPAPPLPLTPQEKLFFRMLEYGNATQLAELNPLVRAQQDADETTAFKTFFPDPPPLKQPLGDTE